MARGGNPKSSVKRSGCRWTLSLSGRDSASGLGEREVEAGNSTIAGPGSVSIEYVTKKLMKLTLWHVGTQHWHSQVENQVGNGVSGNQVRQATRQRHEHLLNVRNFDCSLSLRRSIARRGRALDLHRRA